MSIVQNNVIGVSIPTYNRERYLSKLLDSFSPSEASVFISDNGGFLSNSFYDRYPSALISSTRNITMYENWNRAVSLADTEWVCLASDDDLFLGRCFSTIIDYMNKYPNADVIICGYETIDEEGIPMSRWVPKEERMFRPLESYEIFKYGVDARLISVFFKRSLYIQVGGFSEFYKITASDSEFVQKLLIYGNVLFIPEVLCQYRVWGNNLTAQTIATREWVEEVIHWQFTIGKILSSLGYSKRKIKINNDEVIALNILAGLTSLRKKGSSPTSIFRYLLQFQYPFWATIRTQLRILLCLLRSWVRV